MKELDIFTGVRNIKVAIPEENFLYYAKHKDYTPSISQEKLICDALDNPIGTKPLDEEIPKDSKVIIIVDDVTRPTPCKRIIPHILDRVEKRTKNITFVTAPGTHRPLTDEELDIKIGREFIRKYGVENIDYKREEDFEYIGDTPTGTPLYFHKAVLKADYKIAIGNIAPHNMVGWGGGAKILQPGVSGEITTSGTHLVGVNYPMLEIVGNENCEMRKEVEEIGGHIGLDFIVNTVLNADKLILGLFCGHYIKAHRAGVNFAKEILCPIIPELADIVIVSAYPSNIDYWQALKPLAFSMFGVKKGGSIIFLFDALEGLCNNSPAHKAMLEKYLKTNKEIIMRDLKENKIEDKVGAINPLYHFQILEHTRNIICVTNGLTDEECDLLSFTKAENIQQALDMAFKTQGTDAKVGIIPVGAETLVRLA